MAYFFGSQKDLGPLVIKCEEVAGAPASDLDLGVELREHPLDYREGAGLRQTLEAPLAPVLLPDVFKLLRKKTLNVTDRCASKNIAPPWLEDAWGTTARSLFPGLPPKRYFPLVAMGGKGYYDIINFIIFDLSGG